MSAHLDGLRERRLAIVAACDQDRADVAKAFGGVEHELRIADRVVSTIQRLKSNPVIVGVLAAGTILVPALTRKWVRRASVWLPIAISGYRIMTQSSRSGRRKRRGSDDASTAE
jgi:YqjK-like protein